jgi:hypothetical protein
MLVVATGQSNKEGTPAGGNAVVAWNFEMANKVKK